MGAGFTVPTQENLEKSGISPEFITKLQELHAEMRKRNANMDVRSEELVKKNANIARRIAELEAREGAESNKITALAKQEQEALARQYEGQLEILRQPLEAAKKEYAELQQLLETLKEQKAELDRLLARKNQASRNVAQANATKAQKAANLERVSGELQAQTNKKVGINSNIALTSEKLTVLQAQQTELQGQLEGLRANVSRATEQKAALNAALQKGEANLRNKAASKNQLILNIASLTNERGVLNKNVATLRAQKTNLNTSIENASQRQKNINISVGQSNAAVQVSQQQLTEIKENIGEQTKARNLLTQEVDALQASKASSEEVARLLETKQAELAQVEGTLLTVTEQLQQITTQLQKSKEESEKQIQLLEEKYKEQLAANEADAATRRKALELELDGNRMTALKEKETFIEKAKAEAAAIQADAEQKIAEAKEADEKIRQAKLLEEQVKLNEERKVIEAQMRNLKAQGQNIEAQRAALGDIEKQKVALEAEKTASQIAIVTARSEAEAALREKLEAATALQEAQKETKKAQESEAYRKKIFSIIAPWLMYLDKEGIRAYHNDSSNDYFFINEITKIQKPWVLPETIDKINQKYGLQLQWIERPIKTSLIQNQQNIKPSVGGRHRRRGRHTIKKLKSRKGVKGKSRLTRR